MYLPIDEMTSRDVLEEMNPDADFRKRQTMKANYRLQDAADAANVCYWTNGDAFHYGECVKSLAMAAQALGLVLVAEVPDEN